MTTKAQNVVRIHDKSSVVTEPIYHLNSAPAVLLSLTGSAHGDTLNCAVIPAALVPQIVAALMDSMTIATRNVLP